MNEAAALITIVEQLIKQVEDFQEHLALATKLSDDDRVKAFIDHAADEEAGRVKKLEAIRKQLLSGPDSQPAQPFVAATAIEPDGHYKLRDHNELTVGALLGASQ